MRFLTRYGADAWLKDFEGFVSGLAKRVCIARQALAAHPGQSLRPCEPCKDRTDELARHGSRSVSREGAKTRRNPAVFAAFA